MLDHLVLFLDGEALVIDKPAGLPVDRPRDRSRSLEDMLPDLTFGFRRPPLPVHRLDRDTSGCLLLARNPKAEEGWRMTGAANGKPALTRWKAIERVGDRTMVAFFPETGRTHQLRVHAAEGLGIPIVGDPVYGSGGPAVMLHASELTVPRPGKADVRAEAPLPVRFHNLGFGRG